jgi:hypothetical protein
MELKKEPTEVLKRSRVLEKWQRICVNAVVRAPAWLGKPWMIFYSYFHEAGHIIPCVLSGTPFELERIDEPFKEYSFMVWSHPKKIGGFISRLVDAGPLCLTCLCPLLLFDLPYSIAEAIRQTENGEIVYSNVLWTAATLETLEVR